MDAFAASSVVFDEARAHTSWTRSSVLSILSGLLPTSHGVHEDDAVVPEEITLISEVLHRAGYRTASVVTNGMVSARFGFDQGYDHFVRLKEQHAKNPEIHQLSDRLNEVFVEWLDGVDGNRPFFAYLHATDPHAPYLPRSPYRETFALDSHFEWGHHGFIEQLTQRRIATEEEHVRSLTALYEAEIAYNDAQFRVLLNSLRERGLERSTIVVLTADHGEEFHDHGRWQHGFTLYEEQLHVPLVMRLPSTSPIGRKRSDPVQHIDLMPTLLHVAGVGPPAGLAGTVLIGHDGSDLLAPPNRAVFAVLERHPRFRKVDSVVKGRFKLIRNQVYDLARPRLELFDIAADPAELRDVAARYPVVSGWLETLLDRARDVNVFRTSAADLDLETEQALRALGYLQ
jgi:arylsulfatase A-like enzyme